MNVARLAAFVATIALIALEAHLLATTATAVPTKAGNGVIGALSGEGGDSTLGATLYHQRCAACHDNAVGRIPSKAEISHNTRVFITTTLYGGIMQPMARGLSPHEIASIAAYLATRESGGVGEVGPESLCKNRPQPIGLTTTGEWNGWAGPSSNRAISLILVFAWRTFRDCSFNGPSRIPTRAAVKLR